MVCLVTYLSVHHTWTNNTVIEDPVENTTHLQGSVRQIQQDYRGNDEGQEGVYCTVYATVPNRARPVVSTRVRVQLSPITNYPRTCDLIEAIDNLPDSTAIKIIFGNVHNPGNALWLGTSLTPFVLDDNEPPIEYGFKDLCLFHDARSCEEFVPRAYSHDASIRTRFAIPESSAIYVLHVYYVHSVSSISDMTVNS